MTTALRVTCRQCGDVDATIDRGRLVIAASAQEAGAVVQFDCPRCGSLGSGPVDGRAVSLLLAAGITLVAPTAEPHSVGESQTPG